MVGGVAGTVVGTVAGQKSGNAFSSLVGGLVGTSGAVLTGGKAAMVTPVQTISFHLSEPVTISDAREYSARVN